MKELGPKQIIDTEAIRMVLYDGDLSRLSAGQKDSYYMNVCSAVGLNHLTRPFDFIKFQGKEQMYANKGCAEQLRMIHKIGLKVVSKERIDDVYVVTVEAIAPDGRTDSSTGAVPVQGLKGEALANAYMKAETKAKRRVTLSICGLNMLDESEVESIRSVDPRAKEIEARIAAEPEPQVQHVPEQVPEHVASAGDYVIKIGKSKGKKLKSLTNDKMLWMLDWYAKETEKEDFKPSKDLVEFIDKIHEYLAEGEAL